MFHWWSHKKKNATLMVSKSCSSWWRRWFIPKNPIVGGLSPKTWNKSWESSESRQMGTIKSFFIHQFISYHKKIPSDGNHTIIKKIMFYHINSYHIPKKYRNPMILSLHPPRTPWRRRTKATLQSVRSELTAECSAAKVGSSEHGDVWSHTLW